MSAVAQVPDAAVMPVGSAVSRKWWESSGLGRAFVIVSRWMHSRSRALMARRASRRLTVSETVSLGEKRFVSILCVDGEQFLVGGSSSNVVLLAKLEKDVVTRSSATSASESFSEAILRADREGTGRIGQRSGDQEVGL